MMDGPNTNQIFLGNMNCRKKFKPETLSRCSHSSLSSRLRPHISKLRAFSLVCRTLICRFFQHNLYKIIYLQTRRIHPRLSILSSITKQSSLNIIHTISHVFENKGIHPHFSIGQIFKLKSILPSLPLTILISKVTQNLSKGHCSFINLLIQENFQSLHLFNCL